MARRTILGFACVAPLLLIALWSWSPFAAVGVLMLSHALLLYPTLTPNVQWLGPVVTHFATDRREVWLTIDDGPTADTAAVLDLLAARGVTATFFLKGTLAEARPDLVKAIVARGHSVGNHSYSHPSGSFWCLLPRRIQQEIDRASETLRAILGTAPTWFRAPVGMKNPGVHPALARRGMRLIGWTARGFDGVVSDPERVVASIRPHIRPGTIIVLHQGRPNSVEILEKVIVDVQRSGYAFVVPEEGLLKTKR